MMKTLAPPLKWAGGKRWLVPYLQPLWSPYRNYRLVEPFCGGLGIALGLMPRRALLNDINPHLINFYEWLKRGLGDVLFSPEENNEALYYARRERFNDCIREGQQNTREAAILFYYLNRAGYNGLCRFNRQGLFNVPCGSYKHINYLQGADFARYKPIFEQWLFSSVDFEQLTIESDDLIYADPPYDVPFTSYAQEDFAWPDQERLAQWLANLPNPMVVSNQATDRIVALYRSHGFDIILLDAPRRISSDGDRAAAKEIIATKNIAIRFEIPTQPKLI